MSKRLAALGALLLGVVLVVVGIASRVGLTVGQPTMTADPSRRPTRPVITVSASVPHAQDTPSAQADYVRVPEWVSTLLAIALAALLVGTIVYVASRIRTVQLNRRRKADKTPPGTYTELSEEDVADLEENFRTTVQRLRSGVDVDDAIVACWRQVEAVAERQGLARRPSQTAEEFTVDVLSGSRARREDMTTLADLYRASMFSTRTATEADREAAIACLEALSRDLVAVAPAAPAVATPEVSDDGE